MYVGSHFRVLKLEAPTVLSCHIVGISTIEYEATLALPTSSRPSVKPNLLSIVILSKKSRVTALKRFVGSQVLSRFMKRTICPASLERKYFSFGPPMCLPPFAYREAQTTVAPVLNEDTRSGISLASSLSSAVMKTMNFSLEDSMPSFIADAGPRVPF